MFLNFFKKRKSRKQLLQEIEELIKMRSEYLERWMDKCDSYNAVIKKIKTISATCIMNRYADESDESIVKNCLCEQLAKELLPYISIEEYKYAPVDPHFHGEVKYIATINIVE